MILGVLDSSIATGQVVNETYTINDSIEVKIIKDESKLKFITDFKDADANEYRWIELYVQTNQDELFRFHISGKKVIG